MLTFPRWKKLFILLVCLGGILTALPNFLTEEQRSELPAMMPSDTLSLGLDLQGGVHLLLEAETDDVVDTKLKNLAEQVRDIRKSVAHLNFRNIRISGTSVTFEVTRDEYIERAREELLPITQTTTGGVNPLLGGGVQEVTLEREGRKFTLNLTPEGINVQKRDAVARAMEVIRRRVDPNGTREITVQREGDDRIVLQVPGEDDPEALKRIIQTAAKLTFHDVVTDLSQQDMQRGRLGAGVSLLPLKEGGMIAIRDRVIVDGADLTNAQPSFDQNGRPAVSFTFNTSGARKFGNHTRANIGRPFAIALDEVVISAPTIQSAILGGSGIITGAGDVTETQELATLLKAGALPIPLEVLEQRTVGPDLGADSIAAGEWAAVIGFVGVIIFMTVSYGLFGIAANIALVVNLILIMGALSLFGATLTLPGIAGIVLTIGMAVDANVLVFERIREEQNAGAKPFTAMEQGYGQAFSTIMDANITTFIAAALLYVLGSGPVQGFAVTLGVGIVTSIFTAVVLTRFFLASWVTRARPEKLPI
ncbi:hypothetical protein GCM10017044_21150 [Kordiimonas sediminis]|uniref:Protein translocase subunit SecD n=1 Tax=Kordiimonas sediminis TaxID=1735581 RepID=A0A919ATW9_9PROT|nr:protein translocase subunit SecD [Kordiimonas sediminis]GHF26065.1 hypothetical protein GCM10017044_21150 [Kordiimonas sediminis]